MENNQSTDTVVSSDLMQLQYPKCPDRQQIDSPQQI